MVQLEEMTEPAFNAFLDRRATAKAQALTAHHGVPAAEALAAARKSLATRFPHGPTSAGQLLLSITDRANGTMLGEIWLTVDRDDSRCRGELHDFTVYDRFRRQGYGRQAMAALAAHAHAKGLASVRVWVAPTDAGAQVFGQKCGFRVVGAFMSKTCAGDRAASRVAVEAMPTEIRRQFLDDQMRRQAERNVRELGLAPAAALQTARREWDARYPDGALPADEQLLSVIERGTATRVGTLWFGLHQQGPTRAAFIEDFLIHPSCRRQGYGLQALLALEQRAAELGAHDVSLFVLAHNEPARRLYLKAGFAAGNTELELRLPGRPTADPDTTRLVS